MASYSLAALPHTPPPARGQPVTLGRVLGLDALAMLRSRTFAVFAVASVLACIPSDVLLLLHQSYLNDVGVVNAAGKMTLGQVSELG